MAIDSIPVKQLQQQVDDLKLRCKVLDSKIKQTENKCFVFEAHIFSQRSLTLCGYIEQLYQTLQSLSNALDKELPEALISFECELFINQFQVLMQLVQNLEKGKADKLYKSYSSVKESIYQNLQKQYSYEERLLTMIAEQEEALIHADFQQKLYIKEKIAALKIRFQKCNTYTQKLEFKLEDMSDE